MPVYIDRQPLHCKWSDYSAKEVKNLSKSSYWPADQSVSWLVNQLQMYMDTESIQSQQLCLPSSDITLSKLLRVKQVFITRTYFSTNYSSPLFCLLIQVQSNAQKKVLLFSTSSFTCNSHLNRQDRLFAESLHWNWTLSTKRRSSNFLEYFFF